MLQFGHGSSAVETRWQIANITALERASIRPRLFSRGNRGVQRSVRPGGPASIRPRLFSRGNEAGAGREFALGMLQFGHGSSAVETYAKAKAEIMSRPLQFGHGSSAVETSRRRSRLPSTSLRFNSATALQPWKPLI